MLVLHLKLYKIDLYLFSTRFKYSSFKTYERDFIRRLDVCPQIESVVLLIFEDKHFSVGLGFQLGFLALDKRAQPTTLLKSIAKSRQERSSNIDLRLR